jgi:uncharacterized protein (TIGR02246 family)
MAERALHERIQVLEDIEEIRKLKARYCAGCDDDHNPETVAALFAEDGSWEATGMGKWEGREQVHEFMTNMRNSGRIRNSAHNVFNPNIEVAGDRATGHWRLIMLYTANVADGPAQYFRVIGWYDEAYVRVNGAWLFQSLRCEVEENAPYPIEDDRVG